MTKGVTHSDLGSSNIALLIKCVDDSFDGVVEQVRGLFAGRYKISPCREYGSESAETYPDSFNAPRLM